MCICKPHDSNLPYYACCYGPHHRNRGSTSRRALIVNFFSINFLIKYFHKDFLFLSIEIPTSKQIALTSLFSFLSKDQNKILSKLWCKSGNKKKMFLMIFLVHNINSSRKTFYPIVCVLFCSTTLVLLSHSGNLDPKSFHIPNYDFINLTMQETHFIHWNVNQDARYHFFVFYPTSHSLQHGSGNLIDVSQKGWLL